jgi:2-oxo-4-hydroxy-4-carboxy-5-ureidoimidazoline decarboxylase
VKSRPSQNLSAFVARYGGVYEHSPWVAEQSFAAVSERAGAEELATTFAACVDRADAETRLALIRAHPDLAGRAAVRGELTGESTDEQASAGINQCSPEEFRRFQDFNDRYRKKFGFPFVMAVRNSNRHEILAAFERRLRNDREQEFAQAISEIHKIARMRLEALFRESNAA